MGRLHHVLSNARMVLIHCYPLTRPWLRTIELWISNRHSPIISYNLWLLHRRLDKEYKVRQVRYVPSHVTEDRRKADL